MNLELNQFVSVLTSLPVSSPPECAIETELEQELLINCHQALSRMVV
jgi:hypothetical protein